MIALLIIIIALQIIFSVYLFRYTKSCEEAKKLQEQQVTEMMEHNKCSIISELNKQVQESVRDIKTENSSKHNSIISAIRQSESSSKESFRNVEKELIRRIEGRIEPLLTGISSLEQKTSDISSGITKIVPSVQKELEDKQTNLEENIKSYFIDYITQVIEGLKTDDLLQSLSDAIKLQEQKEQKFTEMMEQYKCSVLSELNRQIEESVRVIQTNNGSRHDSIISAIRQSESSSKEFYLGAEEELTRRIEGKIEPLLSEISSLEQKTSDITSGITNIVPAVQKELDNKQANLEASIKSYFIDYITQVIEGLRTDELLHNLSDTTNRVENVAEGLREVNSSLSIVSDTICDLQPTNQSIVNGLKLVVDDTVKLNETSKDIFELMKLLLLSTITKASKQK